MQTLFTRSLIAGIVALLFGLIATLLVDVVIPTTNLQWALIAVGFASFFGGFAGYYFGFREDRESLTA